MKEFYIGYLGASPPGIRRRVRLLVAAIFLLGIAGAVLFASAQQHIADSQFEYGRPQEFMGTVLSRPFPALLTTIRSDGKEVHTSYLLCGPGKHGADSLVRDYQGRTVKLRGTLAYRAEGKIVEIIPGTLVPGTETASPPSGDKDLGTRDWKGEIVDSKCFLGVMNPGEGKVHRECAALCLAGGIPPALVTRDRDGTPRIFLLTDSAGAPLPQSAFLPLVDQPVRVNGTVAQSNGLFYLRTSGDRITALP